MQERWEERENPITPRTLIFIQETSFKLSIAAWVRRRSFSLYRTALSTAQFVKIKNVYPAESDKKKISLKILINLRTFRSLHIYGGT
jgi:hypothetical protein